MLDNDGLVDLVSVHLREEFLDRNVLLSPRVGVCINDSQTHLTATYQ